MPLALQALLPLLALLVAAALVIGRPRHASNGLIALGGTALACGVTLIELIRLSSAERVDVPYLTTFPYADLAIRLDGLSLGFGAVTLLTAALLMLVRLRTPGDRRDPWASWLLTTLAVLAVMMAASLLLAYILLQLLTLAWSGTVDEAAPRRRRLRLAIGVSDIGLLLAAGSAIQSVGTSAFSGVPSDTFGPAAFLLALLPVAVRMLALGRAGAGAGAGPTAPVSLEPAIAFAAPAGYLLLRLLALMGGRLPGRAIEVAVFVGALLLAAAAAAWVFFEPEGGRLPASLLFGQGALALALLASSLPAVALASTWLLLQLILLTGLCSVCRDRDQAAGVVARLTLSALPGTTAFVAVFIAGVGLRSAGNTPALLALAVVVLLMAVAGVLSIHRVDHWRRDVRSAWAALMLVIAALPSVALGPLVLPASETVRSLPAGTVLLSPLGFGLSGVFWPAPAVTLLLGAALALLWRRHLVLFPAVPGIRRPSMPRVSIGTLPQPPGRWTTRAIWTVFLALTAIAVLRP